MCGICGYLGDGSVTTLAAMNAAIRHRGPDDSGDFIAAGVGLGHRRLAIIDLASGQQPMVDGQGNALVFNGEIYNFQELRRELEQLGAVFRTHSDTEVLLLAYRQWGAACLERLRGMFAFALWDAAERRLFIARDRVGIKPLYYVEFNGVFYFASEIKALLEIPGLPRRLNRRALGLYLTFRYTPGEETLFAGIKKLLPGHAVTLRPGTAPRPQRYWALHFAADEGPGETEWMERFREVFAESVRLRMISEVPLGAYLSGGLDSSLIVATMSALATQPVETFSVGFHAEKFSELPYAALVARQFGCRHHVLHAEEEAAHILHDVVYHLDEPLGDLATIPTYLMARETKPHVTVVLSGEGADELLAGYPKYRAFLAGRGAAPLLPAAWWRQLSRLAPSLTLSRALSSLAGRDWPQAYLQLAAVFSAGERTRLLRPDQAGQLIAGGELEDFIAPYFDPQLDGLSRLLNLDFHTWLPDDLLLKNDKMTMAHGVEARVPYLDHRLVELCATLPSRFKLGLTKEKLLLRKVMAGQLPATICRRKKTGFSVPLAAWMEGPFGGAVREVFTPQFVHQQGLFSLDYIEHLTRQPLNHIYYRRQFWTLAALGLWQRRFGVT